MSFDADDRERSEQLVLERTPADTSDVALRARAPAPQQHPANEHRVIDAPPLHDDRQPEEDAAHGDKPRAGFLKRHPFAVASALVLAIALAAGAYLYWDNSRHFESTDDSFIAARQFAIQPISAHSRLRSTAASKTTGSAQISSSRT